VAEEYGWKRSYPMGVSFVVGKLQLSRIICIFSGVNFYLIHPFVNMILRI